MLGPIWFPIYRTSPWLLKAADIRNGNGTEAWFPPCVKLYLWVLAVVVVLRTRPWRNRVSAAKLVWGVPTIKVHCRWYALLLTRSVNTQLALCEAWGGALWCYWSAVGCDGPATCSWSRLTALLLGDCWEWACSSLRLAWGGVLFSEARWSQRVDLLLSVVTLRLTERATRTALLECTC
jgi:hypothetical protein